MFQTWCCWDFFHATSYSGRDSNSWMSVELHPPVTFWRTELRRRGNKSSNWRHQLIQFVAVLSRNLATEVVQSDDFPPASTCHKFVTRSHETWFRERLEPNDPSFAPTFLKRKRRLGRKKSDAIKWTRWWKKSYGSKKRAFFASSWTVSFSLSHPLSLSFSPSFFVFLSLFIVFLYFLIVFLSLFSLSFAISRHGSATPGL